MSEPCRRCGEAHDIVACPYVKAVEFDHTGVTITRIEFLTPADCIAPKTEPPKEAETPYPRLGQKTGA